MTVKKVEPASNFPPEEGAYVTGNKLSSVAVGIHTLTAKWDAAMEEIVKTAIDAGAAIAGTFQTPNIGIEKIIVNLVANPNIRYLVLCGAAAMEGMGSGAALKAVEKNGVDDRRVIINAGVDGAYLFNVLPEAVQRFREQVVLIDMLGEMDTNAIRQVVEACTREELTELRGYTLSDIGAYDGEPMDAKLEIKVEDPFNVEDWEINDILNDL